MDEKYDIADEDLSSFLDEICRFNYNKPEGAFYLMHFTCDNLSYDELPEETKDMMREYIRDFLIRGDAIDARLTSDENQLFWKKAQETIPTDEIVLETFNDGKKLSTFWMPPEYKSKGTPADLIFNKTVPLTDVVLNFREFGKLNDKFVPISFRVFLYDDYQKIVDQVKQNEDCIAIIGGVIPRFKYETKKQKKQKERQVAYPICIGSKTDFIMAINIAYKNCTRDEVKEFPIHDVHVWNTLILNTFYGCQLALLNPIVEKVFVKAKAHPIEERKISNGKNNKERKVVYVKRYYIRESDINSTIENYRTHNMRCPLWWVIGHRRSYKSGKTIWISGYWKGKERNKVKDLSETDSLNLRQRLVDMRSAE